VNPLPDTEMEARGNFSGHNIRATTRGYTSDLDLGEGKTDCLYRIGKKKVTQSGTAAL